MRINQKLKTNIKVKEENNASDKNLKDTFYLIFLTQTTLKHFKLSKIVKSTLLKLKTLILSRK
jgi:4-hydroxy-3-methylbut-2-enyl diphosphate reductase IspH